MVAVENTYKKLLISSDRKKCFRLQKNLKSYALCGLIRWRRFSFEKCIRNVFVWKRVIFQDGEEGAVPPVSGVWSLKSQHQSIKAIKRNHRKRKKKANKESASEADGEKTCVGAGTPSSHVLAVLLRSIPAGVPRWALLIWRQTVHLQPKQNKQRILDFCHSSLAILSLNHHECSPGNGGSERAWWDRRIHICSLQNLKKISSAWSH